MSQFEFVAITVSVFVAIALSRLVDGVPGAFLSPGRYWVHCGWMIQKFLNLLLYWWAAWETRALEWDFWQFAFSFTGPVILALQATALARPSELEPNNWELRFFEIRSWFFVGNLLLIATIFLNAFVLRGASVALTSPLPLFLLAAVALLGLLSDNRKLHAGLVVGALGIQLVGLMRLVASP